MAIRKFAKYNANLWQDGDKIFSYGTHVATISGAELLVHGRWSMTTTKHINYVAKSLKLKKVESPKPKAEQSSLPKTALNIAAMFALLTGASEEETLAAEKRFLAAAGASFPDDWDSLPMEEQRRRLNEVKKIFS